jgi:pimeloyl-ACP methyl ester carboxylesterase
VNLTTGPTLHFVEQGPADGQPVVMLHGYSDSSFSWSRIAPLLPHDLHLFMVDQRGHGESSKDQPQHRVADFAADVVAFLDAMRIGRATLVGHSLGSMVAQKVAIGHPERVQGLVLIGAFTRGSNPATDSLVAEVRGLADPVDAVFVRAFQASTLSMPVPETFFERICGLSRSMPARVWRGAMEDFVQQDTTPELGRIRVPTLILWGDKDPVSPRADQEALARIPGATLRIMEGVGHSPNWEQPEATAAEIARFFRAAEAAR